MRAFPMEGKADEASSPRVFPEPAYFGTSAASMERSCPCLEQGHNARKSMPPPTVPHPQEVFHPVNIPAPSSLSCPLW